MSKHIYDITDTSARGQMHIAIDIKARNANAKVILNKLYKDDAITDIV